MDQNKTALERAFEMARTGNYPTVSALKQAVAAEGYVSGQLEGRSLSRQLSELIKAAREKKS